MDQLPEPEALTPAGGVSEAVAAPGIGAPRLGTPRVVTASWALAALAIGAAAWGWLRSPSRPPAAPVVRFSLSFGIGFQPVDFTGSPVALSPDGSRIVYVGNQGKYLGEIRAMRGSGSWETSQTLHYLNATYPEDPKATVPE